MASRLYPQSCLCLQLPIAISILRGSFPSGAGGWHQPPITNGALCGGTYVEDSTVFRDSLISKEGVTPTIHGGDLLEDIRVQGTKGSAVVKGFSRAKRGG